MKKTIRNIYPGEVLLEAFLLPMGISQNALARAAGVPPRRINDIVLGKRGVTADTAIRLAAALGTRGINWRGINWDTHQLGHPNSPPFHRRDRFSLHRGGGRWRLCAAHRERRPGKSMA